MKEYRNPTNVYHPVAAYTRQIEVSRPERWLILSGQIGMKEDGIVPDDPVKQFDVALENLCCNLKTANMDVRDFLKFTPYLVGDERCEATRSDCIQAARSQSLHDVALRGVSCQFRLQNRD